MPENLDSNWGWPNENLYNIFIKAASEKTGLPYAILKALIAKESSFDPYTLTDLHPGDKAVKGLGQLTGNGIGAILKSPPPGSQINDDVDEAYSWATGQMEGSLGPIVYFDPQYLRQPGETSIAWYQRLEKQDVPNENGECFIDPKACEITRQVRSYILGTMDAYGATYNDSDKLTGAAFEQEVTKNAEYSALAFQVSQSEVEQMLGETTWNTLSYDTQVKLTAVQYNISAGNPNSTAVKQAVIESNQDGNFSWSEFADILSKTPNEDTPTQGDTYLDSVIYAQDIVDWADSPNK